jgi:DNA-binding LytR/AlgR family response regulator
MKKIRVYIVDDDRLYIRELKKLIEEVEDLEVVGSTTDPYEAEKDLTMGNLEVDVTFLDIQMPEMDGFELGAKIIEFTEVVYVTAYIEHGPETYRKRAFDFLLKPVSLDTFKDCINNVREKLKKKRVKKIEGKRYFFVPAETKGKDIKVFKDQVVFIEALEKYIKIHLITGKPIVTYLQISEVEEEACYSSYLRVNRSCIVNVDYIKSKDNYMLIMEDGSNISVGKTYRKAFKDEFDSVSIKTKRNKKEDKNPDTSEVDR